MLKSVIGSYGLKAIALLAVALGVLVFGQQATIRHKNNVIAEQEIMMRGLMRQINADRVTIRELETVGRTDRVIYRMVTNAVEQIESSPNADTVVPDDIALAWSDGIGRLRNESAGDAASDSPVGYADAALLAPSSA